MREGVAYFKLWSFSHKYLVFCTKNNYYNNPVYTTIGLHYNNGADGVIIDVGW